MLHKHSKGLTIGLAVLITLGTLVFFLSRSNATPTPEAPAAVAVEQPAKAAEPLAASPAPDVQAAPAIDVAAAMKDRSLGKEDAPVTIIEYASMTCPHCANFETKILPELKKRLIDTGKVKFIYRDFPLDRYALKAAMMARCVAPEKYFNLVDVIFNNQERWARAEDPVASLAQLGTLAGLDESLFKSCTENTELETAILKGLQDAQTKYQIHSTPTFIFNENAEQLSGELDVEKFEKIVEKLMKETK